MLPPMGLTGVKHCLFFHPHEQHMQDAASATQGGGGCEELPEEQGSAWEHRAGSSKRKGNSSQSIPALAAMQGRRILHISALAVQGNDYLLN